MGENPWWETMDLVKDYKMYMFSFMLVLGYEEPNLRGDDSNL